ncbi:membrane transporter [Coprinopsis cinerea AmutBmut pab1-1]|nr:membrane transporter [Coprinopsis cinerea AmutBmut pab1-1]
MIDRNLLPLMCFTFVIMIADQVVIAQSAILGIFQGANLTQDQFNWLATILYLSILAFEYPQNLALQRFPVGKWMAVNIFVWSVALLAHAACRSFAALVACRIVLGMCESVILPGFMIVTSMFYTRAEHTARVGYWYMAGMCGSSFLGLVAFALLHIEVSLRSTPFFHLKSSRSHSNREKLGSCHGSGTPHLTMMIIMGLVTFVFGVIFVIFFPDSPTSAKFLSEEERALAIQRIKVNQTGVENKRFKKEQFIETLKDIKVWYMVAFGFLSYVFTTLMPTPLISDAPRHVPVSMTFQKQIIVSQMGFNALQTTLLSCADGVITVIGISIGIYLSTLPAIGRGWSTIITSIPPLVGSILINVLPGENKVALLFMYWLSFWVSVPYTVFLGWVTSLVAGHTKRITTNAMVLIAAYLGLAVGPLMWKKQYQPRNRVPWIIVALCVLTSGISLFALRLTLYLDNKKRDREPRSTKYDEVYIKKELADGTVEKQHVDKAFLDLTDKENRDFRYVL